MSILRFGPFEVWTHTRELYKDGTKVRLRGQPFQILQMLVSNPGKVVTREEMQATLWPAETFVDFEHGLNVSIRKLRQALSESGHEPRYIETLPGMGYRFIAAVKGGDEAPVSAAAHSDGQGTDEGAGENADIANLEPAVPPNSGPISPLANLPPVSPATDADGTRFATHAGAPLLSSARSLALRIGTVTLAIAVIVGGLFLLLPHRKWQGGQQRMSSSADGPVISVSAAELPAITQSPGRVAGLSLRPGAPVSAAFSEIQGKLWVVSLAQALKVSFPPPVTVPDASFITKGIAYVGSTPNNRYTIATFLKQGGTPGFELRFSGIKNANLDRTAAGPATAMSGKTWGIIIEFTGAANLTAGQQIYILHDDGVALKIDGNPIAGFDPGVTPPTLESAAFSGSTGPHSFDLLYANAAGGGAWLSFFPALY